MWLQMPCPGTNCHWHYLSCREWSQVQCRFGRGTGGGRSNQARLDRRRVGETVDYFFSKGLAESTKRSYAVARARYHRFCDGKGWIPVAVSKPVVCAFVALLVLEGLVGASIKVYLAEVRQAQMEKGFPDLKWGRLGQVLKGIRRHQSERGQEGQASGISDADVRLLAKETGLRINNVMGGCLPMLLWVPQSRRNLLPREGGIRPRGTPHLPRPRVRIKASKTDPFREGTDVYFRQTGQLLCPVSAVLAYMVRRKEGPGPLFQFEDGRPLLL